MKLIEHWLREEIGLDAASVGSGLIQRAVRHRLKALGLHRQEDYFAFLQRSRPEAQELIEAVVVTETWFFRDPEPIAALVDLVKERGLPTPASGPWRILSLPCASGEEPFSLAMALRDGGVLPQWFQIDAVDISHRALAVAARGVYPRNSFRGRSLSFRDRYFEKTSDGHQLITPIRASVNFYQANLLADDCLPGQALYDFVFCRNLLIYLDPAMRARALRKLARLLKPSGLLFVGPVEQPLATEHGFVKADIPMAFACRKADTVSRSARPARPMKRPGTAPKAPWKPTARSLRTQPGRSPLPAPRSTPTPDGADLDQARHLADAGRFDEAVAVCEEHLRQSRTSASGYYLLGLVKEASGSDGALECYRRALYLEPNHYESLLRIAILLQEQGELDRARTYKERAHRLRTRK